MTHTINPTIIAITTHLAISSNNVASTTFPNIKPIIPIIVITAISIHRYTLAVHFLFSMIASNSLSFSIRFYNFN